MNSITMQNVTISKNLYGETVTVTNGVVSFSGYEKDTWNEKIKYRNYSFRAYDQVAEKILKMKLHVGSVVNIVGSMDQFINKINKRLMYFVRIDRIEFTPYLLPPQKEESTQEEIPDETGGQKSGVMVDLNESVLFNMKLDDDSILY